MYLFNFGFVIVATLLIFPWTHGLTPRESESREILSLDGLWDFMQEKEPGEGEQDRWYLKSLAHMAGALIMPVPSSYNDVTQDPNLRDHIGIVWYQRCLFVPQRFLDQSRRIVLYFGSINYDATVWLNGVQVAQHEGGHLPFEVVLTKHLKRSNFEKSCVTVSVNNILTPQTIPQGLLIRINDTDIYPPGYLIQKLNFDFFHYAGIHRSVLLYTTPHCFLNDLTLVTSLEPNGPGPRFGVVTYELDVRGCNSDLYFNLVVRDADDEEVIRKSFLRDVKGRLVIERPHLWWPHLSQGSGPAYLYTLEIQVISNENTTDIYRTKFGIRTIEWTNTSLLINGESFHFRGFGRHEDANVRGRGLDVALAWHDGYLLSWLGINSYRTSHYPYSEESLDVADYFGFVVIAEMPAVGLSVFFKGLLKRHIAIARELVARDKNRPSVIMWSLANEPESQWPAADSYFMFLAANVSALDPTRPITIVTSQMWDKDMAVQHVDVICVNRYAGWYGDEGRLDLIERQTLTEMRHWHNRFNKPVILSEYGAGAIAGLHSQPSSIWTEDYQTSIFYKHFQAFDELYKGNFFLGEMVWNFADFATPQEVIRPTGCMKGVMTRDRRPKRVAHVLKDRYWRLAQRKLCNNSNNKQALLADFLPIEVSCEESYCDKHFEVEH